MNGPLKFLTARKILPLLNVLAKFKRVLACFLQLLASSQSKVFISARACKKNRSARHARECSQRPFVTPIRVVNKVAMYWSPGPRQSVEP